MKNYLFIKIIYLFRDEESNQCLLDASVRTGFLYFLCLQYVLEEAKMLSLNVFNPCAFLFVKQG